MKSFLPAHDLDTSGNKASFFVISGELIAFSAHQYPAEYFNSNWAEQNPSDR